MRKSISAGVLAGLVTLLEACGGDSAGGPRGNLIGVPATRSMTTIAQLNATIAALPGLKSVAAAECDVTVAQINYQTAGVQPGEMTNASGAVLVPSGANCPAGPYPLIAYARGTAVEKAHTNADSSVAEIQLLMTIYAAHGYAVVATDYLGYALSRYPYHPYIHADSAASVIIDSIRAARNAAPALGLALNGKVMLTGYSQGGHAAMAAQRAIEQHYSSEFNVVAAAHLAGTYALSRALIDEVIHPIGGVQFIMPFEITSWQKVYGNVYSKASDVFNAPYDSYIESLMPVVNYPADLKKLPGGTPAEALNAMFSPAYLTDLAGNSANGSVVAARKQELFGWNPRAPIILCTGHADTVVRFFNAQMALDDFRSRGAANVSLVDVDPRIVQAYGDVQSADPATYVSSYHPVYEAQFCDQAAKAFFDLHK